MSSNLEHVTVAHIEERGLMLKDFTVNMKELDALLEELFLRPDSFMFNPPFVVLSQADHDVLYGEVMATTETRQIPDEHGEKLIIIPMLNKYLNKTNGTLMDVFIMPILQGTIYLGAYP